MKFIIFFLILVIMIISNCFADDGQKLNCAGYDWQETTGVPEGLFECGIEYEDGSIQLNPKYTRIIKSILSRAAQAPNSDNSRSSKLLGTFARSKTHQRGSAYIKSDGSGYRVVFFDNGPDYFKNGVARYLADGKMGFINKSGDITILAQYKFVSPFHDGYARFCMDCTKEKMGEHTAIRSDNWQDINLKGNIVIAPKLAPIVIEEIPQIIDKDVDYHSFCNTEDIRKTYKLLCTQGNTIACTGYGKLLTELIVSGWSLGNRDLAFSEIVYSSHLNFEGINSKSLSQTTQKFLQQKCNTSGNQDLCGVLGILQYSDGDKTGGENLLASSCAADIAWACTNIGYLKDLSFEHKAAYKYYNKACSLGNTDACYNVKASEVRFRKNNRT